VKIRIVPLDPSLHDRGAFSCGHDGVDLYLKSTAAQSAEYFKSATFVLLGLESPERILGFFTLAPHSYRDGEINTVTARALKVHKLGQIPMILLGQLGVVMEFQGEGLGKMLLWEAMERAFAVATEVGGVAMITDPIDEQAAAFYGKFGFQTLHDRPFHRMILPMKTIKAAIEMRLGESTRA
jgi:GNAT superfamily N-acetyltransferase